jgi:hypothetical protein
MVSLRSHGLYSVLVSFLVCSAASSVACYTVWDNLWLQGGFSPIWSLYYLPAAIGCVAQVYLQYDPCGEWGNAFSHHPFCVACFFFSALTPTHLIQGFLWVCICVFRLAPARVLFRV